MVREFRTRLERYTQRSTLWLRFFALVQFWLVALLLAGAVGVFCKRIADIVNAGAFSAQVGSVLLMALCILLNLMALLYLAFARYATLLLAKEALQLNIFYLWLLTATFGVNIALLQPFTQSFWVALSIGIAAAGLFALIWTLPNRSYLRKRDGLFIYDIHRDLPKAPVPAPTQIPAVPKVSEGRKRPRKATVHEKPRSPLDESKLLQYEYAPNTMVGSLDMLKKLFEKGLITQEEYKAKLQEQERQGKKKSE